MDTILHTRNNQYNKQSMQSKQWAAGEMVPKNAKSVFMSGKTMMTVFWYSRGDILIDYL